MKIKIHNKDLDYVLSLPKEKHKRPIKPNMFFRLLMRAVASFDLRKTHFKFDKVGMERLGKGENALYLMNHSSFIDLEIVARMLFPKPFNIVTTSDAFVGKDYLLRHIGCIPTKKFVSDPTLVRDTIYAAKKLKSNVVLFPEAGYTFDGTSTTLPDSIGKFVKVLGIPLVMITTYGAFARDPLYNNIQVRKVKVSARMEYLLSAEEIKEKSVDELNAIVAKHFSFDNFRWQEANKVRIAEPFRADYLNRVLYKCPSCNAEGKMMGKGTRVTCDCCGKAHILSEYGRLTAEDGAPSFDFVPDWYRWERECVRDEIIAGNYSLDVPVEIMMAVNNKRIYRVGEGTLIHTVDGFRLTDTTGRIDYSQKPLASYSVNADFNWYEIGDIIAVGNHEALYYCLPKIDGDIVAKTRLATEELYKLLTERKLPSKA